jgi:arylsulfatase
MRTTGYCTDVFFRQGLEWIAGRKNRRQPFLACLTPNAPHAPYISPGREYDRLFENRGLTPHQVAYYAMIRNIDDNLGRLLDRLTDWNLERNTLVIFLTDNGHSIGDLYNAGMRAAKGTPYQGGVRVPSFWRWSGRLTPGDRRQTAAHIDVFPTLAELAGARVRSRVRERLEGLSLVPCLADPDAPWSERTLFTHVGRWPAGQADAWKDRGSAVRRGDFKLINGTELYDLRADPAESRNIAADRPDLVADLGARMDQWWEGILPAARESEESVGPLINPFKALYWRQHGGRPDAALLRRMDPSAKFAPPR